MDEELLRRIRENEEQIADRERDKRLILQKSFRTMGNLDDALSAAWKVSFPSSFPAVIWIVRIAILRAEQGIFEGIATVILGLFFLGIVLPLIPIPCGMGAHWWFHDSRISPQKMATALVLLANMAVLGWTILLFSA